MDRAHGFSRAQEAESREMLRRLKAWQDSREGRQWQGKREQLPVVQIRQGLVEALSQHDVAVVGGDTGCGKTTQVLTPLLSGSTAATRPISRPTQEPAVSQSALFEASITSSTRQAVRSS